jgi:hypothetical protein
MNVKSLYLCILLLHEKETNSFHWKMFLVYKGLPVVPLCYFYTLGVASSLGNRVTLTGSSWSLISGADWRGNIRHNENCKRRKGENADPQTI